MVDRLVNSEANTRRIAMVESCFGGAGVPLAVKGRVLVGEGVLTKMCRKRPKSRQFFLFNDILIYGNIVIGKKKYNKQHIIPLEEVSLESVDDTDQLRNGWLLRTATKSFVVYAATHLEKQEWMAHINKCVEDLLRKSGKKAVENHAAVWVPDAQANVCMYCKKTQFTIIVRRHHCRNCGVVVCGPCSAKKFLLPNQCAKPVRVCNGCYENLSQVNKNNLTKTVSATGSDNDGSSTMQQQLSSNSGIAAGSSGDDDSDEEITNDGHDEPPRFYGDNTFSSNDASVNAQSNQLSNK